MLCFQQISGWLGVNKLAAWWGALWGWGREEAPSPGAGEWVGWVASHLGVTRAETPLQPLGISESDSWWRICSVVLLLLQPLSKRHCRNLKRVTKPYRQAPGKPGAAHSCMGELHRYICSWGLCRGSHTGCGPKGEKCRFGRWGTSSCKMSLTSRGLSSNVSTSGSRACSSIFSTGSSWIWPAWAYYHN